MVPATVGHGHGRGGAWSVALLGLLLPVVEEARAEESPAHAATVIWYRSSSDCPDGADFLARIAARNRHARLAEAGDRIDFVVTLSSGPARSSGRLERQTSEGIVAIREVDGDRCDEVADALALGLVLALERAANATAASDDGASPAAVSGPEPEPVGSPSSSAAPTQPDSPVVLEVAQSAEEDSPVERRRRPLWLGAGAIGRAAAAPAGVWGAALHLEGEGDRMPRLRLAAHALTGTRAMERATLQVSLFTGNVELCPLGIGSAAVEANWCGGFDLGVTSASTEGPGGTRALGLWAAISVLERLRWRLSPRLALEADLGVELPLMRYRIIADNPTTRLHRVDPVGLRAGLGASFRLP